MKKRSILLAMILAVAFTSFAQVTKPAIVKKNNSVSTGEQSIKTDTIKVRIELYAVDDNGGHFITWEDGYLLNTTTFTPASPAKIKEDGLRNLTTDVNGNVGTSSAAQKIYSKKWVEYKIEDIYDLKQYNWK